MNELEQEFKDNFSNPPREAKFSDDPLWESQAWLLRTKMKFGDDIQEFWDTTQGQITTYVKKLNSEDQKRATAEVAQVFNLALRTGFSSCNDQVDGLLQQVFQVNNEEESPMIEEASVRDAPPHSPRKTADLYLIPTGPANIISLVDAVDEDSVSYKVGLDPPEMAIQRLQPEPVRQKDPEPSQRFIATEEAPEIIDVTNDPDEFNDIDDIEQGSRSDESDNVSSGSGKLSLTDILLQSYLPHIEDTTERAPWSSALAAYEEPTMPVVSYPAKHLLSSLGLVSTPSGRIEDFGLPEAESREDTAAFGRLGVDPIDLAGHGSQMEPIDLTMMTNR
jgi:hypothetical protein